MDAGAVIHMIEQEVPFNHLVGPKAIEVSAQAATWRLTQRPEIGNHIQTIHAAALFTLGEGTAGSIVATGFDVHRYLFVLKSAEIRYRRLATVATASATFDAAEYARAEEELYNTGKVDIKIEVAIRNEHDEEACYATYVWALRKR